MKLRSVSNLPLIVAAALLPSIALASNAANFLAQQQQQQSTSAAASVSAAANSNLRMFALAAQVYVYANIGQVPWNVSGTSTPIAYTPFLVYAAASSISASQAQSACGFTYGANTPPGFANPVSLPVATALSPSMSVTWSAPGQYLPGHWSVPLAGVDCAVVWINQPAAQQINIQSYFAPSTNAENGNTNAMVTPVQLVYGIKTSQVLGNALPKATAVWAPGSSSSTGPGNSQGAAAGHAAVSNGAAQASGGWTQ